VSTRRRAAALWVDSVVHAAECVRFDGYVVNGPHGADCDIWAAAIGADGYRSLLGVPVRISLGSGPAASVTG